jgi:hypothetical protein
MEPILDETSLVPCPVRPAPARIRDLARTLSELDLLGARRVLRSVRSAADLDIGGGLGLRSWCRHRSVDRDARLLFAQRLDRAPYIDGPDGLFAEAEGKRAVEATSGTVPAWGAGLAAMTDGLLVTLVSEASPVGRLVEVSLTYVDEEGERSEHMELQSFGTADDVVQRRGLLVERIDRAVANGKMLVERLGEIFPQLRLGKRAQEQIEALSGNEPVFRQLIRHLRALEEGVHRWAESQPFEPVAVTYSVESQATLRDGSLGPMRDFPTPLGFEAERWSLHTKLTGGAGARLYFRAVRT